MRKKTGIEKAFIQGFLILTGSLLYALSMNILIVPSGMYTGGFLGIAQLLRILLGETFPFFYIQGDLAGYIYFLLNVPVLILAVKNFGRFFFIKTIFCVTCYSVFLAVIPIPGEVLLPDKMLLCLAGGILCGAGAAITLIAGCSGGGEEIIGLLLARKYPNFSVGKFSILLNVFIYGIGFWLFDFQIVIYSILFSCITFIALDRIHLQNIMIMMIVITKEPSMEQAIFECVHRGVTKWQGRGGYSNSDCELLLTIVSKKEAIILKEYLHKLDPNVFIIMHEDSLVSGNFQKRI